VSGGCDVCGDDLDVAGLDAAEWALLGGYLFF